MKKILSLLISLIFLFIFSSDVKAQIVINEFGVGPSSWVELYNVSTGSADLSTYKITDSGPNEKNLTGTVGPGGFFYTTFGNSLNPVTPDEVQLYNAGVQVDYIYYGGPDQVCMPSTNGSIGRIPDGGNRDSVDRFSVPSKGESNSKGTVDSCPAPTPTQSPTSAPTNSPTPTATPTKSPTPSPTIKSTPWPTATPNSDADQVGGTNANILGLRDSLAPSDDPTPKSTSGNKSTFPVIALIFIIVGIALSGFAVFMGIKKQKENSSATISE